MEIPPIAPDSIAAILLLTWAAAQVFRANKPRLDGGECTRRQEPCVVASTPRTAPMPRSRTATSPGYSTTAAPPGSSASAASDLGQQRTFRFSANRVYNCAGVKVLGGKSAIIVGNSFRVPSNYAVFIGADDLANEGLRVSEDIMVVANNITDVVRAAVSGAAIQYDCGIFISQFTYSPHNIIVRGNNLAQRTSGTDGLDWSALKLRGIAGENRQWRREHADRRRDVLRHRR